MECYEPFRLIASYSIEELRDAAAVCLEYPSDRALKHEIDTVDRPLKKLARIRRG